MKLSKERLKSQLSQRDNPLQSPERSDDFGNTAFWDFVYRPVFFNF
jgi:hypothetical protein